MSLSPVSLPKKLRDNQFIGDLMNLFERRKIKTGDPSSFENFSSILDSNDAFRSQLFTLCTAISHMSEADLSGEQLLALVARALGGPALPKREGAVEIPDSMRSAFLAGYEAWTSRASEPKEPLPWPNPRQPDARDEAEPTPQSADSEPGASRAPVPGHRTVQEAIDFARERSMFGPPAHSLPRPDTHIEGLTLSELKALLAEIEQRVNRIQPHLDDLTSFAAQSPADTFGRREKMHEIDTARPADQTNQAFVSAAPSIDLPAVPFTADAAVGQAAHRASRPARLNEAAFLARHAYLSPGRRDLPDAHGAAVAPAPSIAQIPAPVISPAAPSTFLAPSAAAAPAADLSQAAFVASISATPAVVAPTPPIVIPAPAPFAPALAAPIVAPARQAIIVRPGPMPFTEYDEPASLAIGKLRVTSGMAFGTLAAVVALIVVVSCLAGIFIYPSLHPKTINDFPDLKPQAQPASSDSAAGDLTSNATQVILAAPGDPSMASSAPQGSRPGAGAGSKTHSKATQPPPVAVWPFNNQVSVREVTASPTVSNPSANSAARRTPQQAAPLYVPSTTMISYAVSAPQPSYPRDQPRGITGTVVVQITVSRDGYVTDIHVVSGPVEMRPATVQAVQAWRFKPYLVNGAPAEATTTLGFLFRGQ